VKLFSLGTQRTIRAAVVISSSPSPCRSSSTRSEYCFGLHPGFP
jgi:hypothetical protein